MLPTDPLTLCTIFTLENANECRLINDQLLEFYYTAHGVSNHGIFMKKCLQHDFCYVKVKVHYTPLMMPQKESPRNHPMVVPKKVASLV